MSKDGESGKYAWKEEDKWFAVDWNEFIKHGVKHDSVATAIALRDAGCNIVIMHKTGTGVFKEDE